MNLIQCVRGLSIIVLMLYSYQVRWGYVDRMGKIFLQVLAKLAIIKSRYKKAAFCTNIILL